MKTRHRLEQNYPQVAPSGDSAGAGQKARGDMPRIGQSDATFYTEPPRHRL